MESQFEDAATLTETDMETVEESSVESPPVEDIAEVLVGPGSQVVVQIHVGDDDVE